MIKYIIFDFDGTLVDSKDVAIKAINQLLEKHGLNRIKDEDIEGLRGLSIVERCKMLKVPLYKLPLWALDFYSLYKGSIKDLSFFPDIKELLDGLYERGYQITIISSNSEHNIREFLQKNKIGYIKHIFCSNKIFGKDIVIKKFLKQYKVRTSEILYVGDEERDIHACKKVGAKIISVDWGFDTLELLKKSSPSYIASSPKEVLNIIQGIS